MNLKGESATIYFHPRHFLKCHAAQNLNEIQLIICFSSLHMNYSTCSATLAFPLRNTSDKNRGDNARWTILRLRYCYIHQCTGLFTNNTGRDSSGRLEKPHVHLFRKKIRRKWLSSSGRKERKKRGSRNTLKETMRVIYVIFFISPVNRELEKIKAR